MQLHAIYKENAKYFKDKDKTYQLFSKFYHREVKLFNDISQKQAFDDFLRKHGKIILKPKSERCSSGICIIEGGEYESLLSRFNGEFLAEELVTQHPEMAKLNASSVNTVRLTTMRMDDRVVILQPTLRCGRVGSVVDNHCAGGLSCLVNAETGIIEKAVIKNSDYISEHPDTGFHLLGFKVPCWSEALSLAEELCQVLPSNRLTGWDLALTENGWVLIEANHFPLFAMQQLTLKGIRPQLDDLLKELDIEPPAIGRYEEKSE